MKNVFRRLLPLMVAPLLMSCVTGTTKVIKDNTTTIMSTSNVSSTEIYLSCQQANGDITYQILLSEKTSLTINGEANLSSGTVSFLVSEMDDKELYSLAIDTNQNFSFPLEKEGNYKIKINHQNFKGSYKLNWAK